MLDYRGGAKNVSLCASCEKSEQATLTNETISIYEGLEEVENVLVRICDLCGNIIAIPARSMLPIKLATEKLLDSEKVSKIEDITVELKSIVDSEKKLKTKSEPDNKQEYPLEAVE